MQPTTTPPITIPDPSQQLRQVAGFSKAPLTERDLYWYTPKEEVAPNKMTRTLTKPECPILPVGLIIDPAHISVAEINLFWTAPNPTAFLQIWDKMKAKRMGVQFPYPGMSCMRSLGLLDYYHKTWEGMKDFDVWVEEVYKIKPASQYIALTVDPPKREREKKKKPEMKRQKTVQDLRSSQVIGCTRVVMNDEGTMVEKNGKKTWHVGMSTYDGSKMETEELVDTMCTEDVL